MDSLVDVSERTKIITEKVIEVDDFEFELKKAGKMDGKMGKRIDIYSCVCRRSDGCKIIIRRITDSNSFFFSKIHMSWGHTHLSKKDIILKKEEEERKKKEEEEIKIRVEEEKKQEELRKKIGTRKKFNSFLELVLPASGVFQYIPEELIWLIACYLEYDDELRIFMKCTPYLDHILRSPQCLRMIGKKQFGIDLLKMEQESPSSNPKMLLEKYKYDTKKRCHKTIGPALSGPVSSYILYVSAEDSKNRLFALEAVKLNGRFLYCFPKFQNDRRIVLSAVQQFGSAIQYASENLKKDREIVLVAVYNVLDHSERDWCPLYYCSYFQDDEEVVLRAISGNPYCLQYASDRLRNDTEIVIAAMRKGGLSIIWASEELKRNRVIGIKAVSSNGLSIKYLHEDLQNDHELVFLALSNRDEGDQTNKLYEHVGESLRNSREFVIQLVKILPEYFSCIKKEFREDREIVVIAMKNDNGRMNVFPYLSEKLRSDPEINLLKLFSREKIVSKRNHFNDNCYIY